MQVEEGMCCVNLFASCLGTDGFAQLTNYGWLIDPPTLGFGLVLQHPFFFFFKFLMQSLNLF